MKNKVSVGTCLRFEYLPNKFCILKVLFLSKHYRNMAVVVLKTCAFSDDDFTEVIDLKSKFGPLFTSVKCLAEKNDCIPMFQEDLSADENEMLYYEVAGDLFYKDELLEGCSKSYPELLALDCLALKTLVIEILEVGNGPYMKMIESIV